VQDIHACLYLVCRHARMHVGRTRLCVWDRICSCAALSSQRSIYSLRGNAFRDKGIQRAFAESIAANPDIALVDLQGVDLPPYVDVLGVPERLRDNCAILEHVQAQRIAQQRVKSAKGGIR
jgi:hypothetical protein